MARKMGRPTSYKPEYCQKLVDAMERGLTFEAFAGELRCSKVTLYAWLDRHPDFFAARKLGEGLQERFYIRMGQMLATGKLEGSTSAWIFLTKNILKWRDNRNVEHTGRDGGAIQVARRTMTREERRAEIDRLQAMREACGDD